MPGTLAIDLGSTTTVVAWLQAGEPAQLLDLPPYSCGDPSVVPTLLWLQGSTASPPLIGRQVLEADLADAAEPSLCRDFKRRIGADAPDGASGAAPCLLNPEEAGALLLECLWKAIPADLEVERLVLTAPIETYRGYRAWLEGMGRRLPVPELALIDEPTAAAIGAGLSAGNRVLVVDIGGGTIDLSLVALEGGEGRAAPIAQLLRFAGRDLRGSRQALRCARVLGKAGIPLGGRDIDHWVAGELLPATPPEPSLLQCAERIKCQLSRAEEALQIWVPEQGPPIELRLTRSRFEAVLREHGLPGQLDALMDEVMASARREGLGLADIDAVLPVGGGSRIPLLRRWLEERCPGVEIRDQRPVEAVALGALSLTPGVRIRDVLARGVSLRCWDQRSGSHRWQPLFVAGQPWPTVAPLEMVLACSRNGQASLELVLGEPVSESRAEVVFEAGVPVLRQRAAGSARVEPWARPAHSMALNPPGQQGVDRMRLRFAIDGDAQLTVECIDLELQDRSPEALQAPTGSPVRLGPVR